MRTIGFIEHRAYKITVFGWSEKYIIKIEAGYFEQSYKFPQENFSTWQDLKLLIDEIFLEQVRKRFLQMNEDVKEAFIRYENKPRLA